MLKDINKIDLTLFLDTDIKETFNSIQFNFFKQNERTEVR